MSEEETDTRSWFLRIASGVVFGPVPTKALRLWVEQGRVQPGNEISLDRKNWIPAPSLEELDIVWYLEDNQGNLTGPFNKRAAEKLIADGRVGEGTSIVHKDDADLAHLVRPAIENKRRKRPAEPRNSTSGPKTIPPRPMKTRSVPNARACDFALKCSRRARSNCLQPPRRNASPTSANSRQSARRSQSSKLN